MTQRTEARENCHGSVTGIVESAAPGRLEAGGAVNRQAPHQGEVRSDKKLFPKTDFFGET